MIDFDQTAVLGKAILGKAVVGATAPWEASRGHFTYEGQCWERVADRDMDTALIKGDSTAAQEAFAARLANILRLNVQNLYVTDSAVINEAVARRMFVDIFSANKVSASQIDALSIAAAVGTFVDLTAEQITGGSFSGEVFTGGTFVGSRFEGTTMVGANYRTSDNADQIGGIAIDESNGIRGWHASGRQTFQLNPADGSVDIAANLRAMNPQRRGMILVPQTDSGTAGMFFTDSGDPDGNSAAIWRDNYSPGQYASLHMRGANGSQGGIEVHGLLTVTAPPRTGISARNCAIDNTDGAVLSGAFQTVSSRRYKRSIRDWDVSPETVLSLRPRTWLPRDEEALDADVRRMGLIAEEVDEAGLTEMVNYAENEDGEMVPESLSYDRLPIAQQVVLVDHEERIAELEQRNADLESRLATIESRLADA